MNPCLLLLYRVRNLGDCIQTLAISRLLPQADGAFRHRLAALPPDRFLIWNGYLDKDAPPRTGENCLFAGVSGPHFRRSQYLRVIAQSPAPVGARDPHTLQLLHAAGIPASLIGCATLTLPPYDGPRAGVYSVDTPGPGTPITHTITRRQTPAQQWEAAVAVLEKYRTAEAVYTTRLHVALPCLAFGTPVCLIPPSGQTAHPARLGLLEQLGVPFGKLTTANVAPWAARYTQFLAAHAPVPVSAGEAKLPIATWLPNPRTPEWWRW